MTSEKDVRVRFRHHNFGDLGPIVFSNDTTIAQIKERLVSEWPADGPFAAETPRSASEIKLILGGRYAEGARALVDYRKDLGDFKLDTIGTMHLIVRKHEESLYTEGREGDPRQCCCVIQ